MTSKLRVAVLMGGWSVERGVSLISGAGVLKAVQSLGHEAVAIDVSRDMEQLLQALTPRPDVACLAALHGRWVEDGCIQGLLEMMGIPYTNSGVLASALAMDKLMSRHVFEHKGIQVPSYRVLPWREIKKGGALEVPYVVKPTNEGSSLGVYVIYDDAELAYIKEDWDLDRLLLVERYIPGREIMVAIMGGKALGVLECRSDNPFCDYDAKYLKGQSEHLVPAPIGQAALDHAMRMATKAYQALGCRGVARADFRYDDSLPVDRAFYLLELNTQPGLTPTSFVPDIARHAGMSYEQLMQWMLDHATCDN